MYHKPDANRNSIIHGGISYWLHTLGLIFKILSFTCRQLDIPFSIILIKNTKKLTIPVFPSLSVKNDEKHLNFILYEYIIEKDFHETSFKQCA